MEPQVEKKKSKKLLFLLIAVVLLGGIGFAVYWFVFRADPPAISLVNGRMYPEFSASTSSYTIYTTESSLTFNCSGGSMANPPSGCDTPVSVSSGESTYNISIAGKTYTFVITRLAEKESTLKIASVTGVPTSWASEATLVVNVKNTGSVKELEYSFDGGKTWQQKSTRVILENGSYRVQARDYFGFLSDIKTVKVEKIDSVAPAVEISKETVSDQEVILTVVATDEASGIKSIKWNTGATDKSITVRKSG
ncbi:hypothetical protein IJG96_02770, partial [Candidatus Saccharibacteria bacterium]|nr:hypothetical protein [Candidatus Saccharibacteria bacterium]